jgi:methylamine--corrinoid protein Co-methyltransferase
MEQALARNSNNIIYGNIDPSSGPCTKSILYESCVPAMNETTSGASMIFGVVSGGGRWKNHSTGLESKFSGEITRALSRTSFKRTDANEIAKKIIPKYESDLKNPMKGKSILECFDMKTLKPTEEWSNIYKKVRKELTDLGLPLE